MSTVLTNLSNRHIHLTDADVTALFGSGHTLTPKVDLLQPGAFAAEEVVTIACGEKYIERVRVVGGTRSETQCEILTGDTYRLGLTPADVPVRLSGDLNDSTAFTVIGPAGSIEKSRGLIIAQRHLHTNPTDASALGVEHGQTISLVSGAEKKRTVLHDVIVRVHEDSPTECHIDTEEGNAAGIVSGDQVHIFLE